MDSSYDLCHGAMLTKEKRKLLFGTVAGGSGSMKPEMYQKKMIEQFSKIPIGKTNTRINLRQYTLENVIRPNIKTNGFDYSEDFDGVQQHVKNKIYVNLKCIVGKGGSQTRSLREVYWFIEGQLKTLITNPEFQDIYFANILDGDEASKHIDKFQYLMSLPEYQTIRRKIFVGDLKEYLEWIHTVI